MANRSANSASEPRGVRPQIADIDGERKKGDPITYQTNENKERFQRKVADIRNHPDLSLEAKRHYRSEAYPEAMEEHKRLVASHEEETTKNRNDLERSVFKIKFPLSVFTQEKETIRMSNRDAYDQAERIVSSAGKDMVSRDRALKGLLERTERSDDTLQADAIYHLACELVMWGVADTYFAECPKGKGRWEAYVGARQDAESLKSRFFGWSPPKKPHEIDRAPHSGKHLSEALLG